jgi:hypothetical protein
MTISQVRLPAIDFRKHMALQSLQLCLCCVSDFCALAFGADLSCNIQHNANDSLISLFNASNSENPLA